MVVKEEVLQWWSGDAPICAIVGAISLMFDVLMMCMCMTLLLSNLFVTHSLQDLFEASYVGAHASLT